MAFLGQVATSVSRPLGHLRMRPVRRLTVLLMNFLVVQLVLVGGGAQSGLVRSGVAHAHHVAPAGAPAEDARADRVGRAAGMTAEVSHAADCPDCDTPAERSPCDAPMSPGACSTMPSCAVALAADVPAAPIWSATAARVDAVSDTTPAGPAAAPELPPPRA